MNLKTRVDYIEAELVERVLAEREVSTEALARWVANNSTREERYAYLRVYRESLCEAVERQQAAGLPPSSVWQRRSDRITRFDRLLGPSQPNDPAICEAVVARMPVVLVKRCLAAFTVRLPSEVEHEFESAS